MRREREGRKRTETMSNRTESETEEREDFAPDRTDGRAAVTTMKSEESGDEEEREWSGVRIL